MSEVFEAFALPAGFETPTPLPVDPQGGGFDCVAPQLDPQVVHRLVDRLLLVPPRLQSRKAGDIADTLGRVGGRFLDAGDPLRAQALDLIERSAAVSSAMAVAILDGMAADWTTDRLQALLAAEFEEPDVLDGFVRARGRVLTAHGPRLCVQIVSGSVSGVGVNALLRSLLVKAPTLVKPGFGDVALPVLFARALREVDPELSDALAIVYWRGGDEALERAALDRAEVAVVYGSDETVHSVRALAPATTRVVGYHHRIGVGLVGREALDAGSAEVAREVARAVLMFEQRGCVCPQLVYVEEEGEVAPDVFARQVAEALRELERELPSAPLETGEAASLQQLRGSAEVWAATEEGEVIHGGEHGTWTVIFEPEGRSPSGSEGRCLRVRQIPDARQLSDRIRPIAGHLQSFGVAGLGDRTEAIAGDLGAAGVSRLAPFSRLSFPPPWWLHDGRGPLRELVRWTELERD